MPCVLEQLVDEGRGARRSLGTVQVSVRALDLLRAVKESAASVEEALRPPTLRNLLEFQIGKLKGSAPPLASLLTRKLEMGGAEATALTGDLAASVEAAPASSSTASALAALDEISVKSLANLADELTRKPDESGAAHTERVGVALEALIAGGRRLAATTCGLSGRRTDFSEANWPKARIEKLYHLCALLSLSGEVHERIAAAALQRVDLQRRLEVAAASATLSRYRRRLNEA